MIRSVWIAAVFVLLSGCARSSSLPTPVPSTRFYPAPGPIADQWIEQLGGTNGNTYAYGVALDRDGNVYTSGATSVGLDVNVQNGRSDLFLAKYDPTGALVWSKQLGTPNGNTVSTAAATDSAGNIAIAGYTNAALGRDPQRGVDDILIAKYDGLGELLWLRQFGNNGTSIAQGVAADSDGNFYISGNTTGAFAGNTQQGSQDFFLAKISSSGNLIWIRQLGAPDDYAYGYRTAIDSAGNAFVAGYTTGALAGNSQNSRDSAFLAKFNTHGNLLWLKQLDSGAGSKASTFAYGVAVDNGDNAYLAGTTSAALPDNRQFGSEDLYVAKYNSEGALIWASQYGAEGGVSYGHDIAINHSNGIFVAGTTTAALGSNTQIGRQDLFIGQFDVSGDLIRLDQTGAADGISSAFAIAADDSGAAFLAGTTQQALAENTQAGAFDLFIGLFRSR